MTSSIVSVILAIMIFVVMLGVGLSLTRADFGRAIRARRALLTALSCQLIVLPAICFLLVSALALPPPIAVGMMLLAASPGGTTAAMFSYLAGGDVALNVALTGINSVLSVITLPVVVDISIRHFDSSSSARIGLSPGQLTELILILLLPIALGMFVQARRSALARRMTGPVKALSVFLLILTAIAAVVAERDRIGGYFGDAGLAAVLFCVISLTLGYSVSRVLRIVQAEATAIALEIGVHNSSLAVAIALSPSLLGNSEMAIPAIVYAIVTVPLAGAFGYVINLRALSAGSPYARRREKDVTTADG